MASSTLVTLVFKTSCFLSPKKNTGRGSMADGSASRSRAAASGQPSPGSSVSDNDEQFNPGADADFLADL